MEGRFPAAKSKVKGEIGNEVGELADFWRKKIRNFIRGKMISSCLVRFIRKGIPLISPVTSIVS